MLAAASQIRAQEVDNTGQLITTVMIIPYYDCDGKKAFILDTWHMHSKPFHKRSIQFDFGLDNPIIFD